MCLIIKLILVQVIIYRGLSWIGRDDSFNQSKSKIYPNLYENTIPGRYCNQTLCGYVKKWEITAVHVNMCSFLIKYTQTMLQFCLVFIILCDSQSGV